MRFVLDCSVAVSWCFVDESDEWTDGILDLLTSREAIVPELWHSEVANVMVHCERKGRITVAQSTAFLHRLTLLPIRVQSISLKEYFSDVLHLARRTGLTSYDAIYLHLSLREGLPLVSKDQALRAAARNAGVSLL